MITFIREFFLGPGLNLFGFLIPVTASLLISEIIRRSRAFTIPDMFWIIAMLGFAAIGVQIVPVIQWLAGDVPLTWRGVLLWRVAPGVSAAIAIVAGRSLLKVMVTARRLRGLASQPSPRLALIAARQGVPAFELPIGSAECFVAGFRPAVYVSRGALDRLDDELLEAALAHEKHHIERRDLQMLVLANIINIMLLRSARRAVQSLALALEESADRAAARRTSPVSVARAIIRIAETSTTGCHTATILPLNGKTHVRERLTSLLAPCERRPPRAAPFICKLLAAAALIWPHLQDSLLPCAVERALHF